MNRKESRERHEPRKAFQDYVRKDPRFGHAEAAFLKDQTRRLVRRLFSGASEETNNTVTTGGDTRQNMSFLPVVLEEHVSEEPFLRERRVSPSSWQEIIPADISRRDRGRLLKLGKGYSNIYAARLVFEAGKGPYLYHPHGTDMSTLYEYTRRDLARFQTVRDRLEAELRDDPRLAPLVEKIVRAIRAAHNDLSALSIDELDKMWEVK